MHAVGRVRSKEKRDETTTKHEILPHSKFNTRKIVHTQQHGERGHLHTACDEKKSYELAQAHPLACVDAGFVETGLVQLSVAKWRGNRSRTALGREMEGEG